MWSRQQVMSEFKDRWYVNLPRPSCKVFCSRNAPASGTNVGGMTPGRVKDRHYLMTDRPAETDIKPEQEGTLWPGMTYAETARAYLGCADISSYGIGKSSPYAQKYGRHILSGRHMLGRHRLAGIHAMSA